MLKKNLSLILVMLLTLLLIVFVIWFFERRIQRIEKRKNPSVAFLKEFKTSITFKSK